MPKKTRTRRRLHASKARTRPAATATRPHFSSVSQPADTRSKPTPFETKKNGPQNKRDGRKPAPLIVGIGASAGGLEALEHFFDGVPADNGLAFVVVTHQQPGHGGLLCGLLKKHTGLNVVDAVDGTEVEADTVYLAPAGKNLSILQGSLYALDANPKDGLRLPIDFFFRSLAQDKKHLAVGIVLSGAGSDGTLGLRAIKGEAGITIAQNPQEAEYSSMPQSAIAAKTVDFVLPVAEMPDRLAIHLRDPMKLQRGSNWQPEADQVLPKIFAVLRDRTGNDFSIYKPKTILRRIERRMNVHEIENLQGYLRFLSEDPHEAGALFQELLIGVTSFFRDPLAYEPLIRKGIAPLLKEKPEGYALRCWVPGCSTGEEAYSLAILLREFLATRKKKATCQIFATDLDKQGIEIGRSGLYAAGIANDVSKARLQQHFTKDGEGYRVKKDIRNMVIFAIHNLLSDPPFTKMDLISCRNLLIYVDPKAQRQILLFLHYALKPKGLLFLGNSESVSTFEDLFTPVDRKWKLFMRREVDRGVYLPEHLTARVKYGTVPTGGFHAALGPGRSENVARKSGEVIENMLLDRYVPASVLVNDRGEILYTHGRTGMYLELAPGLPTRNVVEMAHPGLRSHLATTLLKVKRRRDDVIHERVRMRTNGHEVPVTVTIRRLTEPESLRGLILITFEGESPIPRSQKKTTPRPVPRTKQSGVFEELQYTKHRLQESVEELETSNEEFKATNEELQSTNEELQSTNEELETAKEELQSLNEELVTLNSELQGKLDELSAANDDMQNLLNSTEVATIFLDTDLRIRRFTAEARRVVHLIPADVGRPLSDIASNLIYSTLIQDAQEVLRTLSRKEAEVQTSNGDWYFMRILPYRTGQNIIDGLVLAFLDISVQKEAEQISRAAHAYVESIVETVREPLLVLDADLRIVSANTAFYETFHVTSRNVEGELIYHLSDGQWDIPQLREMLEQILPKNRVLEGFVVDHDFPGVGRRKMILNARRLDESAQLPAHILVVFYDGPAAGREPAG